MDEDSGDVKSNCLKQCFKFAAVETDSTDKDDSRQPPIEENYACRFCRKTFATDSRLRRHGDTVHSSERRFFCSICRTGFTRNEHLKRHVLCHYNERPHKCQLCNKSFARKEYLSRHKMIHTGEKPIACEQCDRKFYRKDHLVKHVNRIHKKPVVQPG